MKKLILLIFLFCVPNVCIAEEEMIYARKYIRVTLLSYATYYCLEKDIHEGCSLSYKEDIVTLYNMPTVNGEKATFKWHVTRVREVEIR